MICCAKERPVAREVLRIRFCARQLLMDIQESKDEATAKIYCVWQGTEILDLSIFGRILSLPCCYKRSRKVRGHGKQGRQKCRSSRQMRVQL